MANPLSSVPVDPRLSAISFTNDCGKRVSVEPLSRKTVILVLAKVVDLPVRGDSEIEFMSTQ